MDKWKLASLVTLTATSVSLLFIGWDWDFGSWLWQGALVAGGFFLGHVVTEVVNTGESK
jgi:hypothetical protein